MNKSSFSCSGLFIVSALFFSAASAWADSSPTPGNATADLLYVPGAYQNWKPAEAPTLKPVPDKPGLFEGYVDIAGTGKQDFKFTNAPDWTHTNFGGGPSGTFDTDGKADGLSVPEPGYYELTADLNKNTWTATKTEWSIIGDSTAGGWQTDTKMTYDPEKKVWSVNAPLKAAGSFKFRANGEWKIDFGIDDTGKLKYVDNPFFTYNPNLKQLTVPEDGTYKITLDLHDSGNYTYSIEKQ